MTSEFQVSEMSVIEETMVDVAILAAVTASHGDEFLLLPFFRPKARKLWSDSPENFVARVLTMVRQTAADPQFAAAFSVQARPASLPPTLTDAAPARARHGLVAARTTLRDALTRWRRWWRALTDRRAPLPSVPPVPAPIDQVAPVLESRKAAETEKREGCGATIILEDFTGHCVDGYIVADPIGDRVCPSCLAQRKVS